jgi:hypothetical protein
VMSPGCTEIGPAGRRERVRARSPAADHIGPATGERCFSSEESASFANVGAREPIRSNGPRARSLAQQLCELHRSSQSWQTPPAKRRSSGTSGPAGSAVTRTRRGMQAFRRRNRRAAKRFESERFAQRDSRISIASGKSSRILARLSSRVDSRLRLSSLFEAVNFRPPLCTFCNARQEELPPAPFATRTTAMRRDQTLTKLMCSSA